MTAPATPPAAADQPAPPKPAGNATVRFLPPQVDTTAQGVITVALIIENAADVSSAPLQVSYDPKVVKLNDAGRGDFFSSDGQIPLFTEHPEHAGAAAMNLNRLPNSAGVSGSGVLTTLIFRVSPKYHHGDGPNLTVRNAQGQVVFSGSRR
jgi:general secretion pathway protein D